jgi:hypothetical protein
MRSVREDVHPYKRFFEALEDLEMVISVHGTASSEADLLRAHVRALREQVIDAWRSQRTAA